MGFISELVSDIKAVPQGTTDRIAVWREVFGTTKEEQHKPHVSRGGSYGKSVLASDASTKRLIEAFRSQAPGGWTDNRWEQTAHFVGIQYVCIQRKCEQMAQAEFQVFLKDDNSPDGKVPIPKNHPGYKLVSLLERPNTQDSFGDLLFNWTLQLDLSGTALTWMVPNQLGIPFELYPIPTSIAVPQPAINPEYPDGYYRIQPLYPYGPFSSYPSPASSVGAPIGGEWMMRFKYPHPYVRYDGYSPLTALRLHLDEIEAMDRSRWYAMKRGVNPSAVLQFEDMENAQPLPEAEIARIHTEFENTQYGSENVAKLYVTTPGSKLEPWGTRPIDMDYQQGWDQLVSFVMAGFGITKPAAGMIEDSSYSTLFATLKQLHLLTLDPLCRRISSGLTRSLAKFFGDDLIVEIRCQRIDDHDLTNSKIDKLMQAKACTKNEVRKLLDMPLTEEEWGEEIAGFEQPPEQPGMPGMGGEVGAGNDQGWAGLDDAVEQAAMPEPPKVGEEANNRIKRVMDEEVEPPQVTSSRPKPGKLGIGALGPRKSFSVNGNGRVVQNGRG